MAELAQLTNTSTAPHSPPTQPNVAFPFGQLTGTVRDLKGCKHTDLAATAAALPAPQLWIVTQKRVVAHKFVQTWRDGVGKLVSPRKPLLLELALVDEFLWKTVARMTEKQIAKSISDPRELEHIFFHYGELSDQLISSLGGLEWQALPTTLLVDANAQIRWQTTGLCTPSDVEAIDKLLPTLSARS